MTSNKAHVVEHLTEGYSKRPTFLKEQALEKVALQLCHNLELKKHIFSIKLKWAHFFSVDLVTMDWEKSISKRSREVCKELFLPRTLQKCLIDSIQAIAKELLVWSGEWKTMFNIPCDFTAQFWTPADWANGHLDEKKIAERLIRDNRISNDQRYRLSCIYGLEDSVIQSWNQMSSEKKDSLAAGIHPNFTKSSVVHLWSKYMKDPESFECEERFFLNLFQKALKESNLVAVMFSWHKLSRRMRRKIFRTALRIQEDADRDNNNIGMYIPDNYDKKDYDNEMLTNYLSLIVENSWRTNCCTDTYPFMNSCGIRLTLAPRRWDI